MAVDVLTRKEALKQIVEHNHDWLKVDITIPLGSTALKKVHTNQWLFTDLPKEFNLANWTALAKALNSNTSRYAGYVRNRWYIESVDITVDVNGKAEMKLGLNAFASTYTTYTDAFRSMVDAYNTAQKNQNSGNTNKQSSASKNTSNAVTTSNTVLNAEWVKKYKIPSIVYNKIKEICKVGDSQYNNVKRWFNWMDGHINYAGYSGHQRSFQTQFSLGSGNCVDNSRLFRAGCLALGVKCNFVQNTCTPQNHQYNKVYLNGKGIIVDTGRQLASWGSNWGGYSSCGHETTESW